MKFKPLLIISYMLLVLFTAACDMFTNDPGKVQNGSADVAIAVVNAPFSATLGEMVDIDISLENRGSKPVTDDITITFSDETNDSTLATFVHSGGLTVDSSAAVFLQWEVNGEPENKNLRISHDFSDSNTENNTASFAIAINDQQQEDIAITRFNVPSEIERGQAAEIELRVTNTGVDTINDEVSITLTNLTTGDIIGQETIDPGFEAGSSTSFLIQMPTGSLNPGEFTIEASHNFEDNTPDNNTGTRSITVTEPDIPDESNIGISSINVTTSASQGEIVDIEVIIENSGNNDVNSAFEITLVDETDGNSIETQQIEGGINAGESTGRTFSWNTENASLEEHTLVVSHSFDDGSTADNAASANITITEPEIADIGITEFSGPSEITQGEE
ncbi:MAG: CARDB domain-containing protein, partial [Balneolaceae bacterium]